MEYVKAEHFPNAVHLGDFADASPEWHEARANTIGGSEIGTIMGLNQWESAYALWAKKLGLIPNEFKENWAVRLGKAFEEPILKLFGEEHPELEIYRAGTFVHSEHTFLHANPDAMAYNKETGEWIVIEIKTARYAWDSVPPHYQAQVQHYMYVMGVCKAYIVAVAGMEWKEYYLEADDFQQSAQLEFATNFKYSLDTQSKPEWDGSEHTYNVVRALHPDIDEGVEFDLGTLGHHLLNASEMYNEASDNFMKLKSMVLDNLGRAKSGYIMFNNQKIKIVSRQAKRDGLPYLVMHKIGG